MRALYIKRYGRFPVLTNCNIPELKPNSVIAQVHYAPINPSDINFYLGRYGIRKQGFPIVGFQGSGVICKAENTKLIGRKISFIANNNNGTHATHIETNLNESIIWPDDVDLPRISTSWINPFSCIGLCDAIQKYHPQTVVISGATSQLSKMMVRFINHKWPQAKLIGISRNEAYADVLKKSGLSDFILMKDAQQHGISGIQGKALFLDCIGGSFAGTIFNKLPKDSIMVNYGRLSGQPLGNIDVGGLYYDRKKIEGFWLVNWLKEKSDSQIENYKFDVVRHFDTFFNSTIRETYKLDNFMEAYHASIKNQSSGKILLDMTP